MKNRTKNKIYKSKGKGKITKVKQIKKNNRRLRGGVESDSPRTKSIKKIQATARGRSTRQTKKATTFNKLLESGAVKYKKAIPTLDLKGINLKGMVLSKRVLNGIDLQKVDLTKATLNGTKLIGANLSGSIFEQVTMKKSDLTKSICKKCNFKRATLNLSDFGNANLEGSTFYLTKAFGTNFENANLKGCVFLTPFFGSDGNPMKATNFKGANLDNCKTSTMEIFDKNYLNNSNMVTFENIKYDNPETYQRRSLNISGIIFKNSIFKKLKTSSFDRGLDKSYIKWNKINKVEFDNSIFTDFIGHSTEYKEVYFSQCKIEKGDLRACSIVLCGFEDSILNRTNFTGTYFKDRNLFKNNSMQKCIFTDVKVEPSNRRINDLIFNNTDLTSSSFNGTNLNRTTFKNCNLQGCQFIPILPGGARDFESIPSDLTNAVFDNCKLQSITFQSTLGLTGRNFEGQDLRRCTFSGCDLTGTILRDCNLSECVFTNAFITDTDFTGSNRENTVFDGAIGRQENETLTPAERGIQVEGENDIPAIYPTDVHAAFRIIRKNNYYDTISSYVNNWQTTKDSATARSNDAFVRWINTFLENILNNVSENKDV